MNGDSHLGGKLHITGIIECDRDIDPYRFISIVAGVGSGKTTFIDNLIKGNVLEHQDGTPVKEQVTAKVPDMHPLFSRHMSLIGWMRA